MTRFSIQRARSLWMVLAAFAGTAALAAACTLNPQPLPPDRPDASFGNDDAGSGRFGNDEAAAAPAPQDAVDGGTVSGGGSFDDGGDAGTTADAESDAQATDASDASDQ